MKQIVVIKLGGSALQDKTTVSGLATLIKGYQKLRYNVVIVHGGGPAINKELEKRSITWKFVDGQRQTTPIMMDVINDVLAKQVNSMLVDCLRFEGVRSSGLSAADDRILLCSQLSPELIQVGKVETVDVTAIKPYFETVPRVTPVIAPIGISSETKEIKYNINADWAAVKIAIALKAKKLIFLTDQSGILDAQNRLIEKTDPEELQKLIDSKVIYGGMAVKVRAMSTALESGIKSVQVMHAASTAEAVNNKCLGTLLVNKPTNLKNGFYSGRAK